MGLLGTSMAKMEMLEDVRPEACQTFSLGDSWPNGVRPFTLTVTMWTLIIVAILGSMAFSHRRNLLAAAGIFWKMSGYSKLVGGIFLLGIMPLIFEDILWGWSVLPAWGYALAVLGFQGHRILREGRRAGRFLPRPAYWLIPCIVLIMATPVCDLFLGRSYPSQASVLVGASTIVLVCLYLIEVYIRYPHLEK